MARYRKIDVRIWNDRKFRELDDNAKLAFLLLLTHPDTNQLGFIRSRSVSLAFDLGWHSDAMSNAIQTLCQKGMLMADEMAGLMFLPNFLKYNPPNGVNGAKSWTGLLDLLPECDLRDQALIRLKPLIDGLPKGTREGIPEDIMNAIQDAIRNGSPQPSRIQEQEQEQEQDINKDVSDETSSSDSPALTLDGESDAPKRAPSVPLQKIVDTYNSKLGSQLGMCRQLNKQRQGNLRQRWADISRIVESKDPKEVLEGFAAFYDKIGRSNFLMGRAADFKATFDWIHNSTNFLKIYEGNYENGRKR
jgi:hypothetical protein|nr:MAG TPA: replisome organizer [Caudoviricetes sp.]